MNQALAQPQLPVAAPPQSSSPLLLALALVAITWIVFWPVLAFDFVEYDDNIYVTENPFVRRGLTAETIRWAVTTRDIANWHPVTWLSLMLDVTLFGVSPRWMHFVNLLLHTANVCLLFAILGRITRATVTSFFVAALFAIHPLHVEGVAWISERKDLLATLFGLLALDGWLRSLAGHAWTWRTWSLVAYALSLMSKQMLVTLPCVMLLLDAWPLARGSLGPRRLIIEKLPYFALAALFSFIVYQAQSQYGTVASDDLLPLWARVANAVYVYGRYLLMTVWPAGLAVFYPHPGVTISRAGVGVFALALLLISAIVVWQTRRRPFLAVGWCWYLGTLVPVIGLVQIGEQQMADRYTYFPLIGVFIALAWLVPSIGTSTRKSRAIAGVIGAAAILACLTVSWIQVRYWRNTGTLFAHALEVTENNALAHNGVGNSLHRQGRLEEAVSQYFRAIAISPGFAKAHLNLGIARMQQGRIDEAIIAIKRASELDPRDGNIAYNLGNALHAAGDLDGALRELRRAVALNPYDVLALNNLGKALGEQGSWSEALNQFQTAAAIDAANPQVHVSLIEAYTGTGDPARALEHFDRAVALDPNSAPAFVRGGQAYLKASQPREAVSQFHTAIALDPRSADAHAGLAEALEALGQTNDAARARRIAKQLNTEQAAAESARRVESKLRYARALMIQQQFAEAIVPLRAALEAAPDDPALRVELAKAYIGTGDHAAARKELDAALRTEPTHPEAAQLLEQFR